MVKLNHAKNRSWTIEQTFRSHCEPKVGDLVLALDYSRGDDLMTIGRLVAIEDNETSRGPFRVDSVDWPGTDALLWQRAYKIPDGVVTVETND